MNTDGVFRRGGMIEGGREAGEKWFGEGRELGQRVKLWESNRNQCTK